MERQTQQSVKILDRMYLCADPEHPATRVVRAAAENRPIPLEPLKETPDGDLPRNGFQPLDPIELLRSETKLPALPQVFMELQDIMRDEKSSAGDLAAVISKDASLSGFLLRIVNSAFYSFPSKIDTISRAVTVIGTGQLSALATGMSLMPMFTEGLPKGASLEAFWKHSIACGVGARALAKTLQLPEAERYFVAGLLHDIGRLAMYRLKPQRGEAVISRQVRDPQPSHCIEQEIYGFDHARLGAMLLRKWNLPYPLVMGVLNHHDPAKDEKNTEPWVVHLADFTANGLGYGSVASSCVPPLDREIWQRLGMTEEILTRVVDGLYEQCEDVFTLILSE